ncbi:type II toxin-antitoxin system RelE family toxin [Methylobacterium platani]|uniref:Plasmid stabilization protein n=2 Tax=Methylobacterium platani TaxID=427683 RepID=A0A179SDZ5_9HYPH|nr:plasmid stabilization protein [Methylobacterium platani]KMO15230.1 plasmid stabilization protein [Methylobacterium platani JCM 14648]OAS26045.1 plasmid stabilization protein [Methylobacterium platani]
MKPITYRAAALRSLTGLPKRDRVALIAKLGRYAETGAGDVRPLTGRPGKRLRAGDDRAVFLEDDGAIDVLAIGHRRDIYE